MWRNKENVNWGKNILREATATKFELYTDFSPKENTH